jgi:hypothetical protein
MGISLNGLTPANTYPGLIKTGDNTAISGTPKVLSDGNGNNLPMEVSTTGVNFTNQLQQGGVAVPTQANLAAKQDTLVSGTNIKTINGTSVLGSGNIVTPSTPPSGVAGAIQFSAGSAFNSDAANLFWDDTNNRLGVGTNAPINNLTIIHSTSGSTSGDKGITVGNSNTANALSFGSYFNIGVISGPSGPLMLQTPASNKGVSISTGYLIPSAMAHIQGSGTTSGTTSLLVQNSGGTTVLSINDAGGFFTTTSNFSSVMTNDSNSLQVTGSIAAIRVGTSITIAASAILQADSTTQGFLPPRMTTTQRDAISSPAAGLVLYNSTTNKLQCYNGSTWNDLF